MGDDETEGQRAGRRDPAGHHGSCSSLETAIGDPRHGPGKSRPVPCPDEAAWRASRRLATLLALGTLPSLAACASLHFGLRAGSATPPGWTADLGQLLPGIDACVKRADGDVRGVTRAWSMAASLTGVRVLRGDGSRLDCIALDSGERVVLLQPVRATSRFADEAAPLYTPKDHPPPAGRCIATVPAKLGPQQVGWLSYATCPNDGSTVHPPAEGLAPIPPSV